MSMQATHPGHVGLEPSPNRVPHNNETVNTLSQKTANTLIHAHRVICQSQILKGYASQLHRTLFDTNHDQMATFPTGQLAELPPLLLTSCPCNAAPSCPALGDGKPADVNADLRVMSSDQTNLQTETPCFPTLNTRLGTPVDLTGRHRTTRPSQ